MSSNAIENWMFVTCYAAPGNGSAPRVPDPVEPAAFDMHLRKSDPQSVSATAPPPKPQEETREVDDETDHANDTDVTNETPAAPAVSPPPPQEQPPEANVAETVERADVEESAGDTSAQVKAIDQSKKQLPGTAPDAIVSDTAAAGAKETTAQAPAENPAATKDPAPTEESHLADNAAIAELVAKGEKAATLKDATEAATASAEQTPRVSELNPATIAVPNVECYADDSATDAAIEEAKAAALKKVTVTSKAEKPVPLAGKRVTGVEVVQPAATATPVEGKIDAAAVVEGDTTEEQGSKNTPAPKKNSKAVMLPDRTGTSSESDEAAQDAAAATTNSAATTSSSSDATAAATPAPEQSGATGDKPAAAPAPPTITPIHESAAPARRSSLTLQPASAERTPGGIRLTEVEQTRFVSRVARAFEAAQQRDGGEIRLRLSPPELGSLRLEVKLQGGVMSARLETETEAARTILLDQLPALKERLAEHNIRVERFDVDVADRRSGGQAQTPDQSGNQPRSEPRRQTPVRTHVPQPAHEERSPLRPGEKGRINVII